MGAALACAFSRRLGRRTQSGNIPLISIFDFPKNFSRVFYLFSLHEMKCLHLTLSGFDAKSGGKTKAIRNTSLKNRYQAKSKKTIRLIQVLYSDQTFPTNDSKRKIKVTIQSTAGCFNRPVNTEASCIPMIHPNP